MAGARLILICGLPGSGKTTLASQLATDVPAVRLCPDEWKHDLGIDYYDDAGRVRLEARLWRLAQELLGLGQSVILENGFWAREERDELRTAARAAGVPVELHFLDAPLDELWRRLALRNEEARPGTAPIERDDLERWAQQFEAPDDAELALFDDPRPAPGWLIDELRVAGAENVDPAHVATYDDKEDARASDEVALLRSYGLGGESLLVDLGAGTGQLTIEAARMVDRVIAVDVSPIMLDRLRAKVAAAGLTNVDVVEAGFLTYEHAGPPADFVYSRWALHHLPDPWKALALHRVRQMLRVGGLLRLSDIVFSFAPTEMEDRFEAWASSLPATDDTGAAWVRRDIEDHLRDEHSTFTWLLEPMITAAGFDIEVVTYSPDGFYAEYIARAR